MPAALVREALAQAGLAPQLVNIFSDFSQQTLTALTLGDLGRLGVQDAKDRQLIQKVAMQLKSQLGEAKAKRGRSTGAPGGLEVGGLIDLDSFGHEDDLLALHACGPALQLSPMSNDKPANKPAAASNNNAQAPVEEPQDPPKIRVVVRKRPMNKKEREGGQDDIIDCHMDRACIVVNETKLKVDLTKYMERHQFNFDVALDETVSNDQVYMTTVQPLVHTLFKNGRASCFAYGQTGSGKTHTMSPLPIRAAADMFRYLAMQQFLDVNLMVSCFEIYGNKVFDLLNQRKRLNILEDGKKQVVVVGLREVTVSDTDSIKNLIEEANRQRSVGSTAANADSSRSHSIMQFALKRATPDGEGRTIGKMSFIDLAGSERGADTYDNNRQTRLEGAEINKSLLALKECIRALDSDARHVPFRGSKLTAVLRDSFLGDQARTVMIANISPNSLSVEHTLNTLRYADRVKELRKDKADRAPGGVTPGEDPAYYAAVQRAQLPPAGAPREANGAGGNNNRAVSRPRTPSKDNMAGLAAPSALPSNSNLPVTEEAEERLVRQQDELWDTILEEEEQLITAHRTQIETMMDIVRKEMNLLVEVDTPGSAIDEYVAKLDQMLTFKLDLITELKKKLDVFKEHLNLEETLNKQIPPGSSVKKLLR